MEILDSTGCILNITFNYLNHTYMPEIIACQLAASILSAVLASLVRCHQQPAIQEVVTFAVLSLSQMGGEEELMSLPLLSFPSAQLCEYSQVYSQGDLLSLQYVRLENLTLDSCYHAKIALEL